MALVPISDSTAVVQRSGSCSQLTSATDASTTGLLNLPRELLMRVCSYLNLYTRASIVGTCREVAYAVLLQTRDDIRNFGNERLLSQGETGKKYQEVCLECIHRQISQDVCDQKKVPAVVSALNFSVIRLGLRVQSVFASVMVTLNSDDSLQGKATSSFVVEEDRFSGFDQYLAMSWNRVAKQNPPSPGLHAAMFENGDIRGALSITNTSKHADTSVFFAYLTSCLMKGNTVEMQKAFCVAVKSGWLPTIIEVSIRKWGIEKTLQAIETVENPQYKSLALSSVCFFYLRGKNNDAAIKCAKQIPDENIRSETCDRLVKDLLINEKEELAQDVFKEITVSSYKISSGIALCHVFLFEQNLNKAAAVAFETPSQKSCDEFFAGLSKLLHAQGYMKEAISLSKKIVDDSVRLSTVQSIESLSSKSGYTKTNVDRDITDAFKLDNESQKTRRLIELAKILVLQGRFDRATDVIQANVENVPQELESQYFAVVESIFMGFLYNSRVQEAIDFFENWNYAADAFTSKQKALFSEVAMRLSEIWPLWAYDVIIEKSLSLDSEKDKNLFAILCLESQEIAPLLGRFPKDTTVSFEGLAMFASSVLRKEIQNSAELFFPHLSSITRGKWDEWKEYVANCPSPLPAELTNVFHFVCSILLFQGKFDLVRDVLQKVAFEEQFLSFTLDFCFATGNIPEARLLMAMLPKERREKMQRIYFG
jgi:hypothetical protein